MKPDKRPLQRVNYPLLWFAKLTGVLPALLYFRPLVKREAGAPHLVLPKGTLLVSNHQSLLDFVLYLLIFPYFGRKHPWQISSSCTVPDGF